jgi:signal transduction histidine kinase
MSDEDQRRAFLRLVSHELRTPLNSILGFSELLSAEILGPLGAPQYKEYAQIIQGSGRRLLTLVNQVLEIGRLQGLELELSAQPPVTALEEAAQGLLEDFAGRRLRPNILAPGDPPPCLADAWGLRTVLTHLIRNAIAFSPEGGEVRLRVQPGDGFVDLLVEDDGEGIDPSELPRLFLPFEQGESALSRRGEGAGLGLTIAELTCQAMGATLSLAPGPAGGVSACVRLKAAAVAPEPSAA